MAEYLGFINDENDQDTQSNDEDFINDEIIEVDSTTKTDKT
jgi:hypothetical protein